MQCVRLALIDCTFPFYMLLSDTDRHKYLQANDNTCDCLAPRTSAPISFSLFPSLAMSQWVTDGSLFGLCTARLYVVDVKKPNHAQHVSAYALFVCIRWIEMENGWKSVMHSAQHLCVFGISQPNTIHNTVAQTQHNKKSKFSILSFFDVYRTRWMLGCERRRWRRRWWWLPHGDAQHADCTAILCRYCVIDRSIDRSRSQLQSQAIPIMVSATLCFCPFVMSIG